MITVHKTRRRFPGCLKQFDLVQYRLPRAPWGALKRLGIEGAANILLINRTSKTVCDKFATFSTLSFHVRPKAERLSAVRKRGQDFAIRGRMPRVGIAGMAHSDPSSEDDIYQRIFNETSVGHAEARDAMPSSDQDRRSVAIVTMRRLRIWSRGRRKSRAETIPWSRPSTRLQVSELSQ